MPVTVFAGNTAVVPNGIASSEYSKHASVWPAMEKSYVFLIKDYKKKDDVVRTASMVMDVGTYLYLFHEKRQVIKRLQAIAGNIVEFWNKNLANQPWKRSIPRATLNIGETDLKQKTKTGLVHFSKIECEVVRALRLVLCV